MDHANFTTHTCPVFYMLTVSFAVNMSGLVQHGQRGQYMFLTF